MNAENGINESGTPKEAPLVSHGRSMVIPGGFLENARNWFDIARDLYVVICNAFRSEERLTACYYSRSGCTEADNPNLPELERLENEVHRYAVSNWGEMATGFGRKRVAHDISSMMHGARLVSWQKPEENNATPYYAALRGIDRACQEVTALEALTRTGPLNDGADRNGVGVYLRPSKTYLNTLLSKNGIERIPEYTINNQLSSLYFYRNSDMRMSLPRTIRVNPPANAEMPSDETPLRIGISSFSGARVFADGASNGQIERVSLGGAGFGARYPSAYDSRYADGVRDFVRRCVMCGCHILVFPELVISPGLRAVIADELRSVEGPSSLFLVVAGSTWENENNVCHMFDGFGNEVGRYYKRSPYGVGERPGDPERRRSVEALSHPGKECTMVEVRGFGLVMPSICKDLVSDSAVTTGLARDFQPVVVCCPAYSASLERGFDLPIRVAAERSLALVCVSNCCGSRALHESEEVDFAMMAAPGYEPDISGRRKTPRAKVVSEPLRKTKACYESCKANGSCGFVVEISYSFNGGGACAEGCLPVITSRKMGELGN